MLKALSVSMLMWLQLKDLSSATEMAASSALLIVNLSGVACTDGRGAAAGLGAAGLALGAAAAAGGLGLAFLA